MKTNKPKPTPKVSNQILLQYPLYQPGDDLHNRPKKKEADSEDIAKLKSAIESIEEKNEFDEGIFNGSLESTDENEKTDDDDKNKN